MTLTINQLAQRNDSTPRTIKHWIEVLGIKPTRKGKRRFFSEVDEANIKPHLRSVKVAEASTNGPNIEADTGLTYAQALMKERAIKERRENEEAEAVQSKRWFPTDKMLEMFAAIVNRMEQLPGKVRSEAGLSETQMAVVQAKVDDTRRQIASDLEGLK
jgi:DNA-binding transcriptional MerR regulator